MGGHAHLPESKVDVAQRLGVPTFPPGVKSHRLHSDPGHLGAGPFPVLRHMQPFPWFADVGFPSVCCEYVLLSLVNKEAALAYGRAEYS